MNLSMRQLEQYVVLAEERHFGRAAERLNMQQPPLSQAIRKLEHTLGVVLVDRSTRSFSLTLAGEAFVADARRILASAEAAVGRARRIDAGTEGVLKVGAVSGLTAEFIPRVVAVMSRRYPALHVELSLASSTALVEAVDRGEFDVALVRGISDLPEGIEATVLFEERFGVALPTGHALASASELALSDLAGEHFIMPSETSLRYLDSLAMAACRAAGFEPTVVARSDSVQGLLSFVAGGLGVTLASEAAIRHMRGDLAFVPLVRPDALLTADIRVVARRRREDRSVRAFVDLAVEVADGLAEAAAGPG